MLYKIKPNKIFAKEQSTAIWAEAKKLLKEAITKTRKHTASLTVLYDGEVKGLFSVTDVAVIEKPILEAWTDYEKVIKRAIDLKAQAEATSDDIVVYFIDKNKAKISDNFRRTNRWKTENGGYYSFIGYANEDEVEKLKKQVG